MPCVLTKSSTVVCRYVTLLSTSGSSRAWSRATSIDSPVASTPTTSHPSRARGSHNKPAPCTTLRTPTHAVRTVRFSTTWSVHNLRYATGDCKCAPHADGSHQTRLLGRRVSLHSPPPQPTSSACSPVSPGDDEVRLPRTADMMNSSLVGLSWCKALYCPWGSHLHQPHTHSTRVHADAREISHHRRLVQECPSRRERGGSSTVLDVPFCACLCEVVDLIGVHRALCFGGSCGGGGGLCETTFSFTRSSQRRCNTLRPSLVRPIMNNFDTNRRRWGGVWCNHDETDGGKWPVNVQWLELA